MKTLVIIQARMGGGRLPGKIAEVIGGKSVLEHVVRRARHAGYTTAVACPMSSAPEMGWATSFRRNVPDNRMKDAFVPLYFPNAEEDDVLARVALTARWANDMDRFVGGQGFGCVVRLTGDCPFVPVAGIDAVAEAVTSGENDYCETRSDPSQRPNGIDAQAMTLELLLEADAMATSPAGRQHLTSALLEASTTPGRVMQLEGLRLDEIPYFRCTVDTPEDLASLRAVATHLPVDPTAGRPTLCELKDLHRRKPELFLT